MVPQYPCFTLLDIIAVVVFVTKLPVLANLHLRMKYSANLKEAFKFAVRKTVAEY